MTKLVELRERMTKALEDLGTLAGKEDRTTDDEARIDTLLAEVNDLGPKIEREAAIDKAAGQRSAYTEPVGQRASGMVPNETRQQAMDYRSLGARYADSDEFRAYQRHPGGKGQEFSVGSFYHRDSPLAGQPHMSPQEVRALVATGALPVDMILPQQVPGVFRGNEAPLNMRDVLINGRTTSDAIVFMRELVFTNAAAETAQATVVGDGAKPESTITFEQQSAPVVTIAHWIPITRQTIEDAAQLVTYVEQRLLTGLERREDNQILNGAGGAVNMTGILNTTGVQAINAAHFTATPVQNAGTGNENINRIRRGKRMVRVTGQAIPNFVVLNPTVLETFDTIADANRQYLLGSPLAGGSISGLWGLRVVESENISTTVALVGDGTMAAVWDRMDARIYTTDSHSDFFVRNIFVLLAEERLALTVFRPPAFAAVTLV